MDEEAERVGTSKNRATSRNREPRGFSPSHKLVIYLFDFLDGIR